MNTETYIEANSNMDLSYSLRQAILIGVLLEKFKTRIAKWHEKFPGHALNIESNKISISSTEREQTMWFLQCFGDVGEGGWKKELYEYDNTKIDYYKEVDHPVYEGQKLTITSRNGKPPPSCIVVEEEVEVPATKVKRKRLVCDEKKEQEELEQAEAWPDEEEQEKSPDQEMLDNNDRIGEEVK